MTKSKRLRPIAKLAHTKELEAARVLGNSQKALNAHELRLTELTIYRQEYIESFMSAGGQGMSITQMRNYRTFLAHLDKAIAHQESIVNSASSTVNQDKSQWFDRLSRKKILDKVVGKYQDQELRESTRNEQKEMDDRISGRAYRPKV